VHVLSVVARQDRSDRVADGVHVHRAPLRRPRGLGRLVGSRSAWHRLTLALGVAREARRLGRFDVVESPEWNAEGLALTARRRTPLVVRLHSGARQLFPVLGLEGWDRRLAIRMEEALAARADVVTGTRSLTSEVGPALGLDGRYVRPIVYPVKPLKPLPPPVDGPPRVAFVGRFEERKGPDVAIRAMPRLLERVPEARLVLRGTDTADAAGGSYAGVLRDLARELGVGERVEIVDRWTPDAIAEELAAASVAIVPSRWESFGLVAAEAASLGRPVVASDIPGLDEVITDGETGRLVAPEDADGFAGAVADLLADTEAAARVGRAAARDVSERCAPDRVAAETVAAYELAIDRFARERARR
jgi:glycogen(starch) synthase